MAKTVKAESLHKSVKRLLRRRSTQEFFKEDGWTANPEEAKSFLDVLEVAETCARCDLNDVEVTLRLDPAASDFFCMPVR